MIIPTEHLHPLTAQHVIWSEHGLGRKVEDTFSLKKLTIAQKSRDRLAEIGARCQRKETRGSYHSEKSMWDLRPAWATKNDMRDSMNIGRHVWR